MPVAIEIKKVEPRLYVGIRRTVKRDGLGPACAEILSRVAGWLASQGKKPAGGPIMVYHSVNEATGDFDVQPAYFVGPPITSMDGMIPCNRMKARAPALGAHL